MGANFIGTNLDRKPLGNGGDGIVIYSSNNTIGSAGDPSIGPNIIAYNGGTGVKVVGGKGNAFLSNSIFKNAATPEIQLQLFGNNQIASPTLQKLALSGDYVTVIATLNPAQGFQQGTTYTIQFFASTTDDLGGGPGQTLLSTAPTTYNANTGLLQATSGRILPLWPFISATVTDPEGNTSQFSANVFLFSASPSPTGGLHPLRGGGGGGGGARGVPGGGDSPGAVFGGDVSGSPDPNSVSALPRNRFHQRPVVIAISQFAPPEAVVTPRPWLLTWHAQDSIFERWSDDLLEAVVGNLWK
jgi:hypothetical protein